MSCATSSWLRIVGSAVALLGIGSVGNAPGPLERLDVEEAQGAEMVGHRTGSQFVHGEELGLVLANVLRSQAIGRAVEVLGEPLDQANVTLCGETGSLRLWNKRPEIHFNRDSRTRSSARRATRRPNNSPDSTAALTNTYLSSIVDVRVVGEVEAIQKR
jgi:hypothetical protein